MSDDEHILFDAKVKNWVCVKKGNVDENTDSMEIARVLASINESMERKSWDFLKDDFDLKNLDEIVYEITEATPDKKGNYEIKGKVTDEKIAACLAKINNPSTTKKFSEKNLKYNNGKEICKAYLTYKVMDLLKIRMKLEPKLIEKYQEEMHKKKIDMA